MQLVVKNTSQLLMWEEGSNSNGFVKTFPHAHQPHLEVVNGDLVLCGMAVGQRREDATVVAFGPQQLAEFLQHGGTVGRNTCVTSQVTLGNAGKLGEQLLGFRVLQE